MELTLRKYDEELQIVYAEVYAPGVPDSQGDFMVSEEIRKAAHNFLKQMRVDQIDVNHNNELTGAFVVESFIARKGDPEFISDSWVVGVHIPDPDLWGQVKKGELNGFSMEAVVRRTQREIEIEVPETVVGKTDSVQNHTHTFTVKFSEEGDFLGGSTNDVNGHSHKITKGTATDTADGHTHRFSFVEAFVNA